MNYIIKKAKIDSDDGSHYFDDPDVVGIIRLWEDGTSPKPTDKYILIGETPFSTGDSLKSKDVDLFNEKINAILQNSKVKLSDYGVSKRRSFSMDIKIPKAVIDGYTG